MGHTFSDIDKLCINTIRTLSIDAIHKANSGHPGLPMGAAPMAYVLWDRFLKHDPQNPHWPDRDRFVLSAGHGSMLLYSLLHLTGYDLSLNEIKNFRQWNSKTPGHPECAHTPGVEATTGPLGQGSANAVGMAMAERRLASIFNTPERTIVDHYTYALVGDGDLMEGIAAEAGSLAGHLKLGKLVYLYDANDISLDGPTSLTFTEDVAARYQSYGWHVQTVQKGDTDLEAIAQAIESAKETTDKPSLIIVKTTIGYGSPNKAGTSSVHGSPLDADEIALVKKGFHWPDEAFHIPDQALEHFRKHVERGAKVSSDWKQTFDTYVKTHPDLGGMWAGSWQKELPPQWDASLPSFEIGEKLATRKASGAVLNALAKQDATLWGGDADLSCSTNTAIKDDDDFEGGNGHGRNIRYGVREHAMAAIANGIAYHGGLRSYAATFFVFSDYMRPSIRLAAMNKLNPIYVWTHDSVALGEDGPTHQPVEHLPALRAIPNLDIVRPADAAETVEAWRYAIKRQDGPTGLVLTRQGVEVRKQTHHGAAGLHKGAYILEEASESPKCILIASGSEVSVALEAGKKLEVAGIPTRVVSMPCWEAFERQDPSYQESVLPKHVQARVAVEAACSFGWERYVGSHGAVVGIDRFGASAPGGTVLAELGITADAVFHRAKDLVQ